MTIHFEKTTGQTISNDYFGESFLLSKILSHLVV